MCDHNYLHAPRVLQAYSGRFNGVNLGVNTSFRVKSECSDRSDAVT